MIRVWRAAVLLVAAGLAFVGAAAGGGRAAWLVFGSAAGLAVFGIAAGVCLRGEIRVERNVPGHALHAGDTLRIEGTARLPFRFPLAFVLLTDVWRNARTGRPVRGSVFLVPMGRRRVAFSYELRHLERGVYRLAETEAAVADFFDLAGYSRKTAAPDAPGSTAAAGGPAGGFDDCRTAGPAGFVVGPVPAARPGGEPGADARPDAAAAGGVRPYAEGDSVRRIDWRSSLRTGRLMVKTPDEDDGAAVRVLVDHGAAPDDFERALGAAAAFMRMRTGEAARWRERDVVLEDEEGGLSLARAGEAAVLRRLAMMKRGWTGEAVPAVRGESGFLLAAGRLDDTLAEAAIRLSAAGPVRVLAAPAGQPGDTERQAEERLRKAGIGVAFVRTASRGADGDGRLPAASRRTRAKAETAGRPLAGG